MRKNNHSYIPVLAEGRLLGVFSQETLFMRMAEENGLLLHEDTDPEEFEDCLGLEAMFVTENGTLGEKVLGMTTPWDLTKYRADHNGWI